MMKLKPSAKIHRRYLKINAPKEKIEKVILDFLGILGWAEAAPQIVKSSKTQSILAIQTNSLEKVRVAFALSKNIQVINVSGTLKGLNKK
jgi:RNase P/RNase MRP subunit POP5